MPLVPVADPGDQRLADYVGLTDVELRRRREPAEGLFLAEGEKVLRRALAAGYAPRSLLLEPKWIEPLADIVARVDAPVYVAPATLLADVTGYEVHRGALASLQRRALPGADHLLARSRRVLLLEDLNDPTNLGAIFRSAAALGMDAVVLTPRCADPLYRRSVKVSMGAVFTLPYARFERWPDCFEEVRRSGLRLLALTPARDALALPDVSDTDLSRCALMLGAEGSGLSATALEAADLRVRIPMEYDGSAGVDSLNVAAAAAVACYAIVRATSAHP